MYSIKYTKLIDSSTIKTGDYIGLLSFAILYTHGRIQYVLTEVFFYGN